MTQLSIRSGGLLFLFLWDKKIRDTREKRGELFLRRKSIKLNLKEQWQAIPSAIPKYCLPLFFIMVVPWFSITVKKDLFVKSIVLETDIFRKVFLPTFHGCRIKRK